MPRDDLLHLAPDDLAALTNRGTVKLRSGNSNRRK